MSDHPASLQDFIELAQHTMAGHGYAPAESLVQGAGKMLRRLADPVPATDWVGMEISHEDMLQRSAVHGPA
jgi:hypothetical protein